MPTFWINMVDILIGRETCMKENIHKELDKEKEHTCLSVGIVIMVNGLIISSTVKERISITNPVSSAWRHNGIMGG
jgi:5-methylcytosine-specific restriction endonuclease McrA